MTLSALDNIAIASQTALAEVGSTQLLLMDSRPQRGNRVPKNKSFTGCWTCRARKIKCDDSKPTCQRCIVRKVKCEGYGVRLVWSPTHGTARSNRRSIFDGYEEKLPVYSSDELDTILGLLDPPIPMDEIPDNNPMKLGPFGVFKSSAYVPSSSCSTISFSANDNGQHCTSDSLESHWKLIEKPQNIDKIGTQAYGREKPPSTPCLSCNSSPPPDLQEQGHNWSYSPESDIHFTVDFSGTDIVALGSKSAYTPTPGPLTTDAMSHPALLSDLHYGPFLNHWIVYLADMMLPGKFDDNPYKTIFLPMVLGMRLDSVPHQALLHSLCSVAAYHLASKQVCSESILIERRKGIYHQRRSIKFLSQAISDENTPILGSTLEPTLASIIMLALTHVFAEDEGAWRAHLGGGRQLVQCFKHRLPNESATLSKLYNMFLCIEGIGCPPTVSRERSGSYLHEIVPSLSAAEITDLTYLLPELDFRMHSHVGITRPIFDIICLINQILVLSQPPEQNIINAIEAKLPQHDPELLNFQYSNKLDEEVFRTHANLFYYATQIYFRRYIRGESTTDVQSQVRLALEQLRRAKELSARSDNGSWLWPVFVIACETLEDGDSRMIILDWFYRNERLGLRNIAQAKVIVRHVWSHRDNLNGRERDVAWFHIMRGMNQNLLLI